MNSTAVSDNGLILGTYISILMKLVSPMWYERRPLIYEGYVLDLKKEIQINTIFIYLIMARHCIFVSRVKELLNLRYNI